MRFLIFLLFSILWITVVSGIILPGGGGGGSDGSSSSSSEEDGGGGGHDHGHGPRPPPPSRRCPSDWMTFDRPQGRWCVKVFYGPNTQFVAEDLCKAQGATLTGLQNAIERIKVANKGRSLNSPSPGILNGIWLGARRKENCPYKDSCAPMDTFEWTDGQTTGIAGIQWAPPEPNGVIFPNSYSNMPWGQQNCMDMLVSIADGVLADFGYNHGDMDDQHCQQTVSLYACGKTPN